MKFHRKTSLAPAQRRAASLKGHRTRKRMAAAREREQQRRDDEFTAEHGLVRPLRTANHRLVLWIRDRLLWPSSFRPSEE